MPELSIYTLVLFVHVMSAIVLIGSGLIAPLTHRSIREARTLTELRRWLAFSRRSTKWNPVAALALLASGIYLGSIGWWTQAWFFVAVGAWLLNAALAAGVVGRAADSLAEAAAAGEGDGLVPAAVDLLRHAPRWRLAHDAMLANDVAILWVMMAKPDLVGSVAVVAVAVAAAAGASWLRRRVDTSQPGHDEPASAMGTTGR